MNPQSKKQDRAVGFFYLCVRNGWLPQNPALGLGSIIVKPKPTDYYPKEEFEKLLDATHPYRDTAFQRGDAMILSGGKRIRALLLLMRHSGLRIRDAVTMHRSRINEEGELFLYQAKTGHPVRVPLPPEALQALEDCKDQCATPDYYFWTAKGSRRLRLRIGREASGDCFSWRICAIRTAPRSGATRTCSATRLRSNCSWPGGPSRR